MSNNARDFLEKYGKAGVHFPKEYLTLENWGMDTAQAHELIADTLQNSQNPYKRKNAILHPKATKEHIDKALTDTDWLIRKSAIMNKNATSEHANSALTDENWDVRETAINHPKANLTSKIISDHIDRGLDHINWMIRKKAVQRFGATNEHYQKGLNGPDKRVQRATKEVMEINDMIDNWEK